MSAALVALAAGDGGLAACPSLSRTSACSAFPSTAFKIGAGKFSRGMIAGSSSGGFCVSVTAGSVNFTSEDSIGGFNGPAGADAGDGSCTADVKARWYRRSLVTQPTNPEAANKRNKMTLLPCIKTPELADHTGIIHMMQPNETKRCGARFNGEFELRNIRSSGWRSIWAELLITNAAQQCAEKNTRCGCELSFDYERLRSKSLDNLAWEPLDFGSFAKC